MVADEERQRGVAPQPGPRAMRDTIAAHDWAGSPLGHADAWSDELRGHVGALLASEEPVLLGCGAHRTTLYNDAAQALLGANHPYALGRPLADVFASIAHDAAAAVIAARGNREASVGGLRFGAFARARPDGVVCDLAFAPLPGGGMRVVATEQDEARERALDAEEQRYRSLFDSLDEGFCIIEFFDGPEGPLSDYIHVEANAAYEANAGIDHIVGRRLRDMVPAEADSWVARYGAVLANGAPIRFEQELVATARFLGLGAFRIEPRARRQVAVVFQDITPRKQAERRLRELNATLEARVADALAERQVLAGVVESATALVQVVDRDLTCTAINRNARQEFGRLFGVAPEVGRPLLDGLADEPERQRAVRALWQRALDGNAFFEVERFADPAGGTRSFEMRFNPLRDAAGAITGAVSFAYDVTEWHASQERLAEAEEALRQAQKMEAVGQLTGGLAHDFNNLLAGISGAFEMIAVRLAQGRSADVDKYLVAGQGAARRAAALTHRLLAFARRQTLTPKPLVINRLLGDLVELIRRTVGPAVAVETVAAAGLWPALVDDNQLENAILNLCINARDAMPDGGNITIETANRWIDTRTADARGLEPGQYVTVSVSDTGSGIDKETLERVFDPFFTTKPQGEGTGLGLSMVYGFARQSHGHVRIYSEVGQGTTVCIYLPRHLGDVAEDETGPAAAPARDGDGATVLIVDDEPTVRMLVVDALSDAGYRCVEAADGPAGLRALDGLDRVDLLVTDVGLPGGMNGRQVADAARAKRPDLRILFITGYAENAVLNHGHVAPGMEVLTKPFGVDALTARVERLLGDERRER